MTSDEMNISFMILEVNLSVNILVYICRWFFHDWLFLIAPQEADKMALAETTGLVQRQINNWFINQRKRHWKPSEDLQLALMDNLS